MTKIDSKKKTKYGIEMPRVKQIKPEQVFDFQINQTKSLAERTLKSYKKELQNITNLSVEEHKINVLSPIIKNKDDLLAYPGYVISLINKMTDKRLTKCAAYSAIFYMVGRRDLDQDITTLPYVIAFREQYYTEEYKKKLREEGKLPSLEDSDPLWEQIPNHVWDYNNTDWLSQLYQIKQDTSKSVAQRVQLMLEKIAFFENEIDSRVREDE